MNKNNFPDDDFYYIDFERKYHNKIFPSKKKLIESVNKDLERVYAKINYGKEYIVKKTSKILFYDTITYRKDWSRVILQYEVPCVNKSDDEVIEYKVKVKSIKLNDYVISELDKLPNYSEIVFDPRNKPENKNSFNVWSGFKAKKVKIVNMKLIEKVLYHIKEVLSNGLPDINNLILSYLKRIFTEPWKKTRLMLIFFSEQHQIGKGSFFNFLCNKVIGESSSLQVQGLDSITKDFNCYLMNKILVFIDEISSIGKDYYKQFDKVKNMITEPRILITKKGKDSISVDQCMNFIGATNNRHSIYVPKEDERLFICEVSKKCEKKYLNELSRQFEDENVANHFFTYVSNYNGDVINKLQLIEDFQANIPQTQIKRDMIISNLSTPLKFLKDIKEGEFELNGLSLLRDGGKLIGKKKLYINFKKWCSETSENIVKYSLFKTSIENYIKLLENRTKKGYMYDITSIQFTL